MPGVRSDQRTRSGGLIIGAALALACVMAPDEAEAQYKKLTFGFEGGYLAMTEGVGMKPHNFLVGLFGSWKASDHWWFTSKALMSFPGQLNNAPNTVVLLHLVPISSKYYFLTDRFRPYVGITNAFHITFNADRSVPSATWGPGALIGAEFRLMRDVFLGFEGNSFFMFNFEGTNAYVGTATSQLIFFF